MDLSAVVPPALLATLRRRFELGCREGDDIDALFGPDLAGVPDEGLEESGGEEEFDDEDEESAAGAERRGGGRVGTTSGVEETPEAEVSRRRAKAALKRAKAAAMRDRPIDEVQFILAFRGLIES